MIVIKLAYSSTSHHIVGSRRVLNLIWGNYGMEQSSATRFLIGMSRSPILSYSIFPPVCVNEPLDLLSTVVGMKSGSI